MPNTYRAATLHQAQCQTLLIIISLKIHNNSRVTTISPPSTEGSWSLEKFRGGDGITETHTRLSDYRVHVSAP